MSTTRWTPAFLNVILLLLPAAAGATALPVVDGNGDDLIAFATSEAGRIPADVGTDPAGDIVVADPAIVCAADAGHAGGRSDYFVNGKDLVTVALAYEPAERTLFVLLRAEGVIGDVDGDGDPDASRAAPAANVPDQSGIGSEDLYEVLIDIDGDRQGDIRLRITDNEVDVVGTSVGGTSFAHRADLAKGASGRDLEIRIDGIDLPAKFGASVYSGAIRDGLSEDLTRTLLDASDSPAVSDAPAGAATVAGDEREPDPSRRVQAAGAPASVEDPAGAALLHKTVPNPFTSGVSYAYEVVGGEEPVEIGVYDAAGRRVRGLIRSTQPTGRHAVTWDGRDEGGVRSGRGVYFIRAQIGGAARTHRVVYVGN
jgi:hypothetical protein